MVLYESLKINIENSILALTKRLNHHRGIKGDSTLQFTLSSDVKYNKNRVQFESLEKHCT